MLRILNLALAFIFSINIAVAQSALVGKINSNLKEITLEEKVTTPELKKAFIETSESGRYNDVMILQLFTEVNIPDEEIKEWIDSQLADGSWPDVKYADNKRSRWEPAYHSTRIQSMAKVYKTPSSSLYGSTELSGSIHRAMGYWFGAGLRCPNWWYNEIGVPKMMAPAFLLMWDEMSDSQKSGALKVLDNAKFGMTGQNKVWLAGIVLIKGLLIDDELLVGQAREQIASEIAISTGEGLQPDYSFHQHGPMMQFGNYGLAYIGSMAYWARVFSGTSLAFDAGQIDILRRYMSDGVMWCAWRGYFDPSASGRQVFVDSQKGKSYSLSVSAINMLHVDSAHKELYDDFLVRNTYNPKIDNDLTGNKYYYRSDYGVHRTPDWFASVRMHSSRTLGYEIGNSENLKGFYSADGATMIMGSGGEYDNIYPIWNWAHLPGTTVTVSGGEGVEPSGTAIFGGVASSKKAMNRSSFVGGVSDGTQSCMVMDLDRDSLRAKKAYFFIDNALVCLGNSITTSRSGATVHTTIDQAHLRGDVAQASDGSGSWVHHDNKGYVIFNENPVPVTIVQQSQSGNWYDIATMYENRPDVESEVFSLYIDHGQEAQDETYAYAVLPGRSTRETDIYANNPGVKILSNSAQCQAVATVDGRELMAIFHMAGKISLPDIGGGKGSAKQRELEVDRPCLVMITFSDSGDVILNHAISSPHGDIDKIALGYRWSGEKSSSKTSAKESIVLSVSLNGSKEAVGSSVVYDNNSGH